MRAQAQAQTQPQTQPSQSAIETDSFKTVVVKSLRWARPVAQGVSARHAECKQRNSRPWATRQPAYRREILPTKAKQASNTRRNGNKRS